MNPPDKIVSRSAIINSLAEYLEQSDTMVLDLFRELERRMMYGIHLHPSMNVDEIASSLNDLIENYPRLINFERFRGLDEELWGEVAWAEICWNLG